MIDQDQANCLTQRALPSVVLRYAEEVATRWWRRGPAYSENPRTRLEDMIDFDERIDAFLDGLVQSGEPGRLIAEQNAAGEAPDAAADIFVALALAARTGDETVLDNVVEKMLFLPGLPQALEGLFAWSYEPLVRATLARCLHHSDPRIQDAAFSQCYVHGHTGGQHLSRVINGPVDPLLARALRTAGECGRVDLLPAIGPWVDSENEGNGAVRFWAAWSTIMLGGVDPRALFTLKAIAASGATNSTEAMRLLCIALPQDELREYLQSISGSIEPSLLVQAAGWSGHCGYVPYLIEQMRFPALATYAGESFRLITGFDFEMAEALIDPSPYLDDAQLTLVQELYPYPDADRAATWWHAQKDSFSEERRLVLGEELDAPRLDVLLLGGEQAQRELAIIYRALARPGDMIVPLYAHSSIQWLRLQQLNRKIL